MSSDVRVGLVACSDPGLPWNWRLTPICQNNDSRDGPVRADSGKLGLYHGLWKAF